MHEKLPGEMAKVYSILFTTIFLALLLLQLPRENLALDKVSDGFLWRTDLIKYIHRFRFLIGDRVFPIAVVGRDGWLFYAAEMSIQDYQNTAPLNKRKLQRFARLLTALDEQTAKNGGVLVVIVPPNKSTIYPDYMPAQIPVIGSSSRLDQFLEYIHENSAVQVLDVRPAMRTASRSYQVYGKADTHWNCLGAHSAYTELLSALSKSYPMLMPHPLSDFDLELLHKTSFDLSELLGVFVEEDVWTLTPKSPIVQDVTSVPMASGEMMRVAVNPERPDLPSALVFHDSFYQVCLNQLLEPHFSRTVSIPYTSVHGSGYFERIDRENADIVIIEFTERYIEFFLGFLE